MKNKDSYRAVLPPSRMVFLRGVVKKKQISYGQADHKTVRGEGVSPVGPDRKQM